MSSGLSDSDLQELLARGSLPHWTERWRAFIGQMVAGRRALVHLVKPVRPGKLLRPFSTDDSFQAQLCLRQCRVVPRCHLRRAGYVSKGFVFEAPDLLNSPASDLNAFQDQLCLLPASLHEHQRLQVQYFCDSNFKSELRSFALAMSFAFPLSLNQVRTPRWKNRM